MRRKGFTLIELLIVVAIIAILAAIAVPNFLEAQTRAKVTRVRTDFRSIIGAMEAYHVDNDDYPPDDQGTSWYNDFIPMTYLTTPIPYLSSVLTNPFFDIRQSRAPSGNTGAGNYAYWRRDAGVADPALQLFWHVISCGPNLTSELGRLDIQAWKVVERHPDFMNKLYDPTNGTVSYGDLHCTNRGITF